MAIETNEFVEEYTKLERHRKVRNIWLGLSAAGVALGTAVAVVSGSIEAGGLVAGIINLGTDPMAGDAHDAVTSVRHHIDGLIYRHELEAQLVPEA